MKTLQLSFSIAILALASRNSVDASGSTLSEAVSAAERKKNNVKASTGALWSDDGYFPESGPVESGPVSAVEEKRLGLRTRAGELGVEIVDRENRQPGYFGSGIQDANDKLRVNNDPHSLKISVQSLEGAENPFNERVFHKVEDFDAVQPRFGRRRDEITASDSAMRGGGVSTAVLMATLGLVVGQFW